MTDRYGQNHLPRSRNTTLVLLSVAALALALRLAYTYEADDSPLFDAPMVDAKTYADSAREMAQGAWSGDAQPFWQPPLYSYALATLFALFGEDYYLVRFVQAAIGTAVCVLICLLGRRVFSPSVGLLAAGMAAAYGPFIYFEGELLPAGLAVFLNLLLLLTLLWAARGDRITPWFLSGIVLGLSGLTVANVFLFAPVVFLWALYFLPTPGASGNDGSLWSRLRHPRLVPLAVFALGILLVVAPVTVRNRVVGGEWVLVSYNAGVNFYIGTNPEYDETVRIRPGREWLDLVNAPETEAGITGRSESSLYHFGEAWEFVKEDPLAYVSLLLRKVHLFWRGDEIPRNLDAYYARDHSTVLTVLLWKSGLAFPFGLIAPLALLGVVRLLASPSRKSPAASLILLFTVTYFASVVLFFERYRLPVVPLLLLLAAFAILSLLRQRGRTLALSAGALCLLLLASNTGVPAMASPQGEAYNHHWKGAAFESKGLRINALREYRRAVEIDPSHHAALTGLASMYASQQDYDGALKAWEQILRHYPDRADVMLHTADLSLLREDYQRAAELYERVVPQRPDWAALYGRLGYARLMAGSPDRAVEAYRKTLELNPDSLLVRYQLGQIYEEQDEPERALAEYDSVLARQPDHVEALCRKANLMLIGGEGEEAEALLRKALSVAPRSVMALRSVGRFEVLQGNLEDAIPRFEAIVELQPDDYEAYRTLAHLYLRVGERGKADEAYEIYERGGREREIFEQVRDQTEKLVEEMMRRYGGR